MGEQLTNRQQYCRVCYMGMAFMIMFTSFNSLQIMVSKLYEDYDFQGLGQTSLMFIYFACSACTMFSSFFIKKLGYKKVMFISSLGYVCYEATGLLVVTRLGLPSALVWTMVCFGAIICGCSASVIWIAQGAYISMIASKDRQSALFGIFWALMMSSQILGNSLSTFVLGTINDTVYFIVLTILGAFSSSLFLFLPSISTRQQDSDMNIKSQIAKFWAIIKNPLYVKLNIYFLFPGLTLAFFSGFLYKIIALSVKQEEGEPDSEFVHRLNLSDGFVFIALGVTQLITGLLMNRFAQKFCRFKLAVVGTLIVEMACLASFIAYFLESYPLCFLSSCLWGSSQTFLQTNTSAIIAQVFPKKVEGYSVYRVFLGLGSVLVFLFTTILSSLPPYYFLTLVLLIQIVMTAVAYDLKQLNIGDRTSLLTEDANNNDDRQIQPVQKVKQF